MKVFVAVLLTLIILVSCKDKKEIKKAKTSNFTSIEFTYRNEVDSFFDLRVDSNKIFFNPNPYDTIQYGIIPDSLFSFIDSSISYIVKNKPFQEKEATLKDTCLFGIVLIANNDTIKILQTGKGIAEVFLNMIKPLEMFAAKKHLILNNAGMLLKTYRMTIATPEPLKLH